MEIAPVDPPSSPRSASVLVVAGTPGFGDARALHAAAREAAASGGDVVVDCADAGHLNAAVLQILVALARHVRGRGDHFSLSNAPPPVDDVLRLTALYGTINGDALGDLPTAAGKVP
jgi:anti-anti-sigma regulatory factor